MTECASLLDVDYCTTVYSDIQLEEGTRAALQEDAISLAFDMFGLMVTRCTELLQDHLASDSVQILNEDLEELVPSIKVWSDWMSCHPYFWNPPPLMRDPQLGLVFL